MKRIVTPKYVEHMTMNVYVKDSQISADLSTLSATGKDQKGKKFFVDLLVPVHVFMHPILRKTGHRNISNGLRACILIKNMPIPPGNRGDGRPFTPSVPAAAVPHTGVWHRRYDVIIRGNLRLVMWTGIGRLVSASL